MQILKTELSNIHVSVKNVKISTMYLVCLHAACDQNYYITFVMSWLLYSRPLDIICE
jgi:hypothetical protein